MTAVFCRILQRRTAPRCPLVTALLICACLLSLGWPKSLGAAPSCGLEQWLSALNQGASAYTNALGTPAESDAARMLRNELERYDRHALLKQIDHAALGANRDALVSFIAARRHLLDLHQQRWPEMAARYGKDPRFAAQSGQMEQFLRQMECDPNAPDFLSQSGDADEKNRAGIFDRLVSGVTEISELLPHQENELADALEPPDPNDFSAYKPKRPDPVGVTAPKLAQSGNAAFVLGIFTFLTAVTVWIWMRYGIRQRRSKRYPCALPVVIFDGIVPVLGEVLDLSQIGAKIETSLTLKTRQKLKLTINTVEIRCRVAWKNQHFVGVEFSKPISEQDIADLLGPFANKVAAERETMGDLAFCDQFDFPVHPTLLEQDAANSPADTDPTAEADAASAATSTDEDRPEKEPEDAPQNASLAPDPVDAQTAQSHNPQG